MGFAGEMCIRLASAESGLIKKTIIDGGVNAGPKKGFKYGFFIE